MMAPRLPRPSRRARPHSDPDVATTMNPSRTASLKRIGTDWFQRAIEVPHDLSLRSATRLREENPSASPTDLIEIATRRFVRRSSLESAAVGAAAAVPGAGTAVGATASVAQLAAFVSEAAHYTMVVAHLSGIDLRDPSKRTALVLSALTGREGAEAITSGLGIQTLAWFRSSFVNIRTTSALQFNSLMTHWLRARIVSKATSGTLARLLPFGAGAVIGAGLGRSMARSVVEGVRLALGDPPLCFPPEALVIDVIAEDAPPTTREIPFGALSLPSPDDRA